MIKGTSQPTPDVFRKVVLAPSVSAENLLLYNNRGQDDSLRYPFEAVFKLEPEEDMIISGPLIKL